MAVLPAAQTHPAVVLATHPAMVHQHLQDAQAVLQVVRADVSAHVAVAVQVRSVAAVLGHVGQAVLADALALVEADAVPAVLHRVKADAIKVVRHHVLESVEDPLAVAFVPTYVTEDSVMEAVRVLVKLLVKEPVSIPAI